MTESFRAGEIVERKLDGKIVYATSFEQRIRSEGECTCSFGEDLRSDVIFPISEAIQVHLTSEYIHSFSNPHVYVEVEIFYNNYPEIVSWFAILNILNDQDKIDCEGRLNRTRLLSGEYRCSGRVTFRSYIRKSIPKYLKMYGLRFSVVIEHVRKMRDTMKMYGSQYEYTRINKFNDYFGNEKFSDVSIICNDNTLPAHRIILIGQSEYFDAMITHGFREGMDPEIRLDNHNFNMIRNLVHFMYTEKLIDEVDENNCHAIYESAVYFGVTGLKKYLTHYFIKLLNRDNFYTTIRHIISSDELKTAINRFRVIHDPLTYAIYYRMADYERKTFLEIYGLLDKPIKFFDSLAI